MMKRLDSMTTPTEMVDPLTAKPLPRRLLVLGLVAAAAFLYLRGFMLPGTPLIVQGDQTLFFARAVRVMHGQVPYRDFFELVTPGTDLLYAAAFRVLGVRAWVMQAWSIVLGVGFCAELTWIAAKVLRRSLVMLPALLFLVFDYNSALDPTHHWYSTLAALAAVRVLCGGATRRRVIAAGALCGVSTLFTQTTGACALAAVLIYLWWLGEANGFRDRAAKLAVPVLAFCVVVVPVLGYYACQAGFGTLWFDLVVYPIKFLSSNEVNSPQTYLHQLPAVHSVADVARFATFLFVYLLVPYIYLLGLYLLRRHRDEMPAMIRQRLMLLNLMGIFLALAVASGPRFHRICMVAAPACIVFVWTIARETPALRAVRAVTWVTAVAFALWLPVHRQREAYTTLNLPTGRLAVSDVGEAAELQWLANRTRPGDAVFNLATPGLYLALDDPAPVDF
jgi:hypothetical protein